jgi:hypothetical protein
MLRVIVFVWQSVQGLATMDPFLDNMQFPLRRRNTSGKLGGKWSAWQMALFDAEQTWLFSYLVNVGNQRSLKLSLNSRKVECYNQQ